MRLTPQINDKIHTLILTGIAVVGMLSLFFAIYAGQQADTRIRNELEQNSVIAAGALDSEKVMSLTGTEADEDSAPYTELKRLLANIKKSDERIRSAYLTGERDDRLFFYVDSEQPDSEYYSPAGEFYDEATPVFKAMFTNKQTLVEGPISDSFGTFISGLAPMFDPKTGEVIAVVGIDVGADDYWRDIFTAAALPLTVGLLLIIVLLFFEWNRRKNEQLLTIKSELVSVASHEIRNPLTGIRWAATSLEPYVQQQDLPRKLTHSIIKSAEQLQASTDDILELSHAMNKRKLQIEDTDVSALIQEICGVQMLTAQQKGVILGLDATWPQSLIVKADATMLKRVLYNVISNAIKYTNPNTTVTFSYDAQDKMNNIHITDQGIGIPKDEQAEVYKGFYRASNAKSSNIPGTGLGLYLVKTVIEGHGGRVTITSEENKGTRVTLSLPIEPKS